MLTKGIHLLYQMRSSTCLVGSALSKVSVCAGGNMRSEEAATMEAIGNRESIMIGVTEKVRLARSSMMRLVTGVYVELWKMTFSLLIP